MGNDQSKATYNDKRMDNLFMAHEPLEDEWVHGVKGKKDDKPKDLGTTWDIDAESEQFTMCAWVNVKKKIDDAGYRILSKRRGKVGWEFVAPRCSSGRISFFSNNSHVDVGGTDLTDPANHREDLKDLPEVEDKAWHHVLLTYHEGTLRAYLDGKFDGEAKLQVTPGVEDGKEINLWMGSSNPDMGGGQKEHMFLGELRHVQVFQNALHVRQIRELARPEYITWSKKKWNTQVSVPPAKWCVDRSQLHELAKEVQKEKTKWQPKTDAKEKDKKAKEEWEPNVYEVNEKWIKPQTISTGLSWALQKNRKGLPVKWFVSHAWAEKFKDFVVAIDAFAESEKSYGKDDGIWICFLANPQTWPRLVLSELFGSQVFHSPFAVAMEAAKAQLVVRTELPQYDGQSQCVYSRLWCVFEAWIASGMKRDNEPLDIIALGKTYSKDEYETTLKSLVGIEGAACSSLIDKERIQTCINNDPGNMNDLIKDILLAKPMQSISACRDSRTSKKCAAATPKP